MAFWKQSFRGRTRRIFRTFPDAIKKTMKLHFVESMDQVLKIALEREVVALPMAPTASVDLQAVEQSLAH